MIFVFIVIYIFGVIMSFGWRYLTIVSISTTHPTKKQLFRLLLVAMFFPVRLIQEQIWIPLVEYFKSRGKK